MSDVNTMLNDLVDVGSMVSELQKNEKKTNFWRPSKPKTAIRILPPIKANGEKLPVHMHKTHWINGQPYECLSQTEVDANGNMHNACECPICKMVNSLYAAKTDEATALAKKLSAKTRYIARVIVRNDPDLGDKPVFYELPFTLYNKFKNALVSKEWGSLVGVLDGRDMDVIKEGEGILTNYDASSFKPAESKIADTNEKIVSILQTAKDMPYNTLISFKDASELKNVAMQNSDVARFFGDTKPSQPTMTIGSKVDAPVFPDVPEFKEEKPSTSANDDLDSLLAGLV